MSVQLRCVKCNGVLREIRLQNLADPLVNDHVAYQCPNCGEVNKPPFRTSAPVPTHEEQVITLLTEIRDELRDLNNRYVAGA